MPAAPTMASMTSDPRAREDAPRGWRGRPGSRSTTAATMPMPPMVGVPALAMWTWGPSSRICWPMLCFSSQRMRNGVVSTATHRATPPEVMSEITAGAPAPGAADPLGEGRGGPPRRSSKGDDPVRQDLGGLMALAGEEHDVPGPGRSDGAPGWPRPGRARPPAPRRPTMPAADLVDDGHRGPPTADCPRSGRRRRPAGGHRAHLRALPLVAVATAAEHARGPVPIRPAPGPRPGPRRARPGCGRSRPGRRTGDPDDTTSIRPGIGSRARPARRRPGPRPIPRAAATVAAIRALSTLNSPVSGTVTGRPRHRNEEEPDRHHDVRGVRLAGRRITRGRFRSGRRAVRPHGSSALTTAGLVIGRLEQPRLGLEVPLHGPVVVEVVAAQIGEGGHIEDDAVDPVLGRARGRRPPWPRPGCRAARSSASWAWRSGASGVVRSPSSVPMTPGGHAGVGQDRPHQLGHRRLAVGTGDADHVHRPRGVAVEGGGHAWPWPA